MENKIIYLQRAVSELMEINDWHGKKVAEQIRDRIIDLKLFPKLGKILYEDKVLYAAGYRKIVCGDFVVIYRHIKDEIFIYHIGNVKTDYTRLFQ